MSKNQTFDRERDGRKLRELRLWVPDARDLSVRRRVVEASAKLPPDDERGAMRWIEAVSEFDSSTDDLER